MKCNIYILAIVAIGLGGTSCKKTGADTGTAVDPAAPAVTTVDATKIGTTTTIGGNITNDGGSMIKEAGVVYGTSTGVDTSKNRARNYTISGPFSVDVSKLSLLTTYYYKAY